MLIAQVHVYNINTNHLDEKLGGDMVYYKNSKFRTGWGNMSSRISKPGKSPYILDLVYL